MSAYAPGIGVAGGEGLLGDVQHIKEAPVIQVGYIHHDLVPLQFPNRLLAEGGQAMVRHISRGNLVFPVPGKGHHPHSIPGQRFNPGQLPGQSGTVFHREYGRRPALFPGGFYFGRSPAGTDPVRQRLHLPVETALVHIIVAGRFLLRQSVRDKNSTALAPVDVLRDGGQGEVPPGKVQRVRPPNPAAQRGQRRLPPCWVLDSSQQMKVLVGQGDEGVAMQVNQGIGIHKKHSFTQLILNGYGFFMVSEMRFFFSSTSTTQTVITSPTESSSEGCFTRRGSLEI